MAIFDWEWGRNSAPREGQKNPVNMLVTVPISPLILNWIKTNVLFVLQRQTVPIQGLNCLII